MSGANPEENPRQPLAKSRGAAVAALLRILLGILFSLAGLFKLLDQPLFFAGLMQFSFLSANFLYVLSWFIGPLELLLGLWLLTGKAARGAGLFGAALLVVFSVVLAIAWAQDLEVSCPCFGPLQIGNSYAAWLTRNVLLILAFFWIARRCPPRRRMV